MSEPSVPQPSVRLDVWLWAARFFKTRSLAKQAVDTGKIALAGQRPKSSRAIRVGEQLQIERGEEQFEIQVTGLSDQRGPAPVAQQLYAESEASRAPCGTVRAAYCRPRRLPAARTPPRQTCASSHPCTG
ncbi:MAG: Heat shock protein 15 [Stenotrophomonas maltophilia]|nr:MAG: Heat shock protein 15 [Stenotrophomonas maltophilia]